MAILNRIRAWSVVTDARKALARASVLDAGELLGIGRLYCAGCDALLVRNGAPLPDPWTAEHHAPGCETLDLILKLDELLAELEPESEEAPS